MVITIHINQLPSCHQLPTIALQVEQLENQLRADGGVAAKPGSGKTGEGVVGCGWMERMISAEWLAHDGLWFVEGWVMAVIG